MKKEKLVFEYYSKTPVTANHIQQLTQDGAVILKQDNPNHMIYYYPKKSKNPKLPKRAK